MPKQTPQTLLRLANGLNGISGNRIDKWSAAINAANAAPIKDRDLAQLLASRSQMLALSVRSAGVGVTLIHGLGLETSWLTTNL